MHTILAVAAQPEPGWGNLVGLLIGSGLAVAGVYGHRWYLARNGTAEPSPAALPRAEDAEKPQVSVEKGETPARGRGVLAKLRETMREVAPPAPPKVEQPVATTPPDRPQPALDDPTAADIARALAEHGVDARVVGLTRGPRVDRYEVMPGPGVKVGRVTGLAPNLTLATRAEVRVGVIPGGNAIGVEVPRAKPDTVRLEELLATAAMTGAGPLVVPLGKGIDGATVVADLAGLPHLLIAGTTGGGKSTLFHGAICTLITRNSPDQLRALLVDTKRVELAAYAGIPHLAAKIVTSPKAAVEALKWAVAEMDDRYAAMEAAGVRDIEAYNRRVGTMPSAGGPARPYPRLVVGVEELADLMMVGGPEVEDSIVRLGQLGRAAGVHLVLATQRPSVDVVTGRIKANVPARLAFVTASRVDSQVILDRPGAEKLLGAGDALWLPAGAHAPVRVQCALVDEDDIAEAVTAAKAYAGPAYRDDRAPVVMDKPAAPDEDEQLLAEARWLVVESQMGSVSMLQRKLRLGYARAGALMDELEKRGVVGPPDGSRPREVLIASGEEVGKP